jgi:hypothetical protein
MREASDVVNNKILANEAGGFCDPVIPATGDCGAWQGLCSFQISAMRVSSKCRNAEHDHRDGELARRKIGRN